MAEISFQFTLVNNLLSRVLKGNSYMNYIMTIDRDNKLHLMSQLQLIWFYWFSSEPPTKLPQKTITANSSL